MSEIFKAAGIGGNQVPDLNISASKVIETTGFHISGWESKMHEFYDGQAKFIFDQLSVSLPGGTMDALLGIMLKNKASLFSCADKP